LVFSRIIITLLSIICIIPTAAESAQYHLREMAFITVGGVYAASSNSFLDGYQDVLGGNNVSFKHTPAFGAGLKFWLNEKYRISASGDYFFSSFSDSYSQFDSLEIGTVNRSIISKLSSSTLPLVFSIDYIPIEQQFKTYISFGSGVVISNTKWTESVNSTRSTDTRIGGTLYEATDINPLLRAAVGMELDFDKSVVGNIIGNLTIEARYTYMFRKLNLFENIKNQLGDNSSQLESSVEFIPGYLSLNLQFGIEYFQTIGK